MHCPWIMEWLRANNQRIYRLAFSTQAKHATRIDGSSSLVFSNTTTYHSQFHLYSNNPTMNALLQAPPHWHLHAGPFVGHHVGVLAPPARLAKKSGASFLRSMSFSAVAAVASV